MFIRAPKAKEHLQKYYDLLEFIRQSGVCNMFAASGVLQDACPELDADQAQSILVDWIQGHNNEYRQMSKPLTKWGQTTRTVEVLDFKEVN